MPPLTRQQVALIFRGQITDWSQVGGRPGSIHLYGRRSDSGTFDTFVSLVLGGDKNAFARTLTTEPNGDEITQKVSTDVGGVGYVALAQIGNTTALELSAAQGATPLLPSPFTVATEDYILARRLFLYTPSSPTEFAPHTSGYVPHCCVRAPEPLRQRLWLFFCGCPRPL